MWGALDRAIISQLCSHLPFVYRSAIQSAFKIDFTSFINYRNIITYINLGD